MGAPEGPGVSVAPEVRAGPGVWVARRARVVAVAPPARAVVPMAASMEEWAPSRERPDPVAVALPAARAGASSLLGTCCSSRSAVWFTFPAAERPAAFRRRPGRARDKEVFVKAF